MPLAVGNEESLARFILFGRWVRNSDQTVKPEALMPHPHTDLSVTRHLHLSEEVIWSAGQGVADARGLTLYGRADFLAGDARKQLLEIESDPAPNNPNHANIISWPLEKPAQKIIAQQLAANSVYRTKP